jgi:hypothetical protein
MRSCRSHLPVALTLQRQIPVGLPEAFGRRFVVGNRGGAGGLIGIEMAAKYLPEEEVAKKYGGANRS